jgi:NHL repeat containing protein
VKGKGFINMKKQITKFRYVFYVLLHPFDGFYDLKHEKRGSGLVATVLYILLGLTALLKRQYSEYLFNLEQGENYNAVILLLTTVGPYLLWCVSNWCFTSLMDGEGNMKDMLIATGYALTPLIFSNLICLGMSWVLVEGEANFLYTVETLGAIWAIAWVFFAMMVTQQYSLGKSMATAMLTLVGMALILFILLLLFYLVQQLTNFAGDFVSELEFRLTI